MRRLSFRLMLRSAGALLLAGLVWSGCRTAEPPPATALPTGADYDPSLLKEGDVISVVFPGATNLNSAFKIPFDGMIQMPFAGQLKASGRNPDDLEVAILEMYGDQLKVQEVNVTLVSSSAGVYISGAVLRPGKIPLDRPMTAMEAIMECGGFENTRARPSEVLLIRQEEGRQVTYKLDLKKALNGEDTTPVYLKPSDVLHVPFKTFNL